MAVDYYCDYCGERILDERREVITVGRSVVSPVHNEYQYCEGCLEEVDDVLHDMHHWAMGKDGGSGLVWKLVEQSGAVADQKAKSPSPKQASKKASAGFPVGAEYQRRCSAGTPLADILDPHNRRAAASLRRHNIVTVEELAERSEIEIRGVPLVGPTALRIFETELERLGLTYRPGPSPAELGREIAELRNARGLGCEELADLVNAKLDDRIFGSRVSGWESGRNVPTAEELGVIASIFECSPEDLVERAVAGDRRES